MTLPPDLVERLKREATESRRTFPMYVEMLLDEALSARDKKPTETAA